MSGALAPGSRVAATALALALAWSAAMPQPARQKPPSRPVARRPQVTVTAGFTSPLSHTGIREFWKGGPGGAVTFTVPVSRNLGFGAGFEGAIFWFREGAFAERYPGVPMQHRDVGFITLSVSSVWWFAPGMRLNPSLRGHVGASKLTAASYKEVVAGVRKTYYDIPGRTRLSLGLTAGADLVLARGIALEGEAKLTYVHDDPDIGLAYAIRGGMRFTL